MTEPRRSEHKLPNEMWRQASFGGARWVLYTEDMELVRVICGWNAFKDERIRVMAYYYPTVDSSKHHAVQFRFTSALKDRVAKAAGLPVYKRQLSAAQLAAARMSAKALSQRG